MKHPNILATQIATATFYVPPPAYGEADIAVPSLEEANIPQVGALAGDQAPDWDHLEQKFGGEAQPEVVSAADPTAISPETPAIPQEPAKAPTPEEKPPETPAAAPETPKAPETKPLESGFDSAAATQKIAALEISPKASATTKEGFQNLKAITAQAVTEVETLRAKLAEKEKQAGLTPEVEAELKTLREFRETWGVEHDPEFLKPFNERLTKADEDFVSSLQTNTEIKLPATDAEASMFADEDKTLPISAETLKRVGIDSPQGQQITNRIFAILQKAVSPITYNKALRSFEKRDDIIAERDARIADVKGKQGGYVKALEAKEEAERGHYGAGFNAKMVELVKGVPWLTKKAIAPDATPEAKKLAEEHNAWIDKDFIEQVRGKLGAVYMRDPAVSAETIYKAVAHDHVAKERDALLAEKTQLEARVAELQKTAQGVRQVAAAPARASGSPVTPSKEPAKLNQSSDEAIDDFLAQRAK